MRGEATVLLMLLLAGCVGGNASTFPEALVTPTQERTASAERAEGASRAGEVLAPELRAGQAWTYEGKEFYNEDTSFTVVVAQVTGEGYLFAGGAEDDLVYEALWWSMWYGMHDRSLNRVDFDRPFLSFPLRDGASWPLSDTTTLTARAAEVDTPLGKDAGFVIEGADERRSLRVEYSPRAQNIVRLVTTGADGTVWSDLRMTRVAQAQPWVWYELGPLAVASNPHEPALLDVPEGYDHVIVSAGGTEGGRARVDTPGGPSWSVEFSGDETWRHGMLPAEPGRWVGAVAGRPFLRQVGELPVEAPVGWAYMHAAPVKWLYGTT